MVGWEQRQELVGKPFFDELSERYATPGPRRQRVTERFDLRLSGGQVLLPGAEDLTEVDVLVRDGTIAGLCAPGAPADAAQDVSVRGLAVLPGIIDAHVHLGQDITVPKTRRRRPPGDRGGRGRRRHHADRLPDDGRARTTRCSTTRWP